MDFHHKMLTFTAFPVCPPVTDILAVTRQNCLVRQATRYKESLEELAPGRPRFAVLLFLISICITV